VPSGRADVFTSDAAPDEPHEFEARLVLERVGNREVLPFRMSEPEGHSH
jgi:hypothetical protein